MENNAGITTKKNSRKTLITVLVALVAAAVVLGGIMIALKLKAEKEEAAAEMEPYNNSFEKNNA